MIRTLIEVSAETEWEHGRQLRDTLDRLGYEPKRSEEHGRFMANLWEALRERDIDPRKLVEEREDKLRAEAK